MTTNKEINGYQHDYTLRAKTYMEDGQSEKWCVPWQQTAMHYQEMWLVHNNDHKINHMHH